MWKIMQIEEDAIHRGWRPSWRESILRDLHNSTAELNNWFIIHSKYFQVLNRLTFWQTSFKTLAYSSARFQDIKRCFLLQWDTPLKVDKIHQTTCLAYSCISFIQFKSEVQLFRLRISMNAIFSSLLPKPPSFQSNIPSNRWYIARIFQIWYRMVSPRWFCRLDWSQSETAKYFEWKMTSVISFFVVAVVFSWSFRPWTDASLCWV